MKNKVKTYTAIAALSLATTQFLSPTRSFSAPHDHPNSATNQLTNGTQENMNQNNDIYNLITTPISGVNEPMFKYFDLTHGYDITLNVIQPGSSIPVHTHNQTVFNYVFEGSFVVKMNGVEKAYKKGDWLHISAHTEHSVLAENQVILLELWKK